jgi:plasmid stabilization system protein ParE
MEVHLNPLRLPGFPRVCVPLCGPGRVARTIYTGVAALPAFPHHGRTGLSPDTRELVVPPWPYIIVSEIVIDTVNILRIRHASQDWP